MADNLDGESELPVVSPPPATAATIAPSVTAPPAMVQPDPPVWVVVKPGDSLWLLAERYLGDPLRWQDIYELNSGPLPGGGTLRDPNLIHPGWRLLLPQPGSAAPAGSQEVGPFSLRSAPRSPDNRLG
jgi:nucleoid-associated protein YgaU